MHCASCGSENPDGAKFCIECAAPLRKRCPSCGVENLPRAKFCAECATPLIGRQEGGTEAVSAQLSVATPQPPAPSTQPQAAERRQLTLSRLGRPQVEAMVEKVTGGKALPKEVIQQIVVKTDGVPLFVEELTKSVVEAERTVEVTGRSLRQTLTIPATLQDALMARLDRLGAAKEIAQLGATIGREFHYEVLRSVSPLDENALHQGLRQLVETELVFQSGVAPQVRYLFKHALIQDTAYQSLLKSTRQQYHQQIAQILEEKFPETKETQPELVAHHYTEARLIEQAIPYWQKAGQRAFERLASVEAISHFTKGLELLKTLPGTPERAQQEVTFQMALGFAFTATKSFAAPEAGKVYARALELCRQGGETPQLFPVLTGLWGVYVMGAVLPTARELAEQILSLAQRVQDPALLVGAHQAFGQTLFYFGEFAPAREHLAQSVACYDSHQHRSLPLTTFQVLFSFNFAASTLWMLGHPDQALKKIQEALALAHELAYPFPLAIARYFAALLHQCRREGQAAQQQAEAALALSAEQGFAQWLAQGTILQGWALTEQGQGARGIAQIHQGLAVLQVTGVETVRSYFLALLAEAYGKGGQAEEGLSVLTEALAGVNKTGVCYYEAELYRLKGELTLQQESKEHEAWSMEQKSENINPHSQIPEPQLEAEACFLKAIEIARKQQAKSLELRAATSLARLWQQQGKSAEAHKLLLDVYNWFTEGFDTKDLQEAKALIDSLASSV